MPMVNSQNSLNVTRHMQAFLNLEAGIVRGAAPSPNGANAAANAEIVKLRAMLAEKEREISALKSPAPAGEDEIHRVVEDFHKLYYESGRAERKMWRDTNWMGTTIWKCPLDLWIYQEIIHELKPDLILETGTSFGGSSLFLAHMCDIVGHGEILTVDIGDRKQSPEHERVSRLLGSSTSEEVMGEARRKAEKSETVLVILDSDHRKDHVLKELALYGELATKGSYVIVEDTNVNGNPVFPEYGPGPMEAIEEFLRSNKDFVVDEGKEKFYMTFSPKGYLKKVV